MTKRILSLLLALTTIFTLCACGKSGDSSDQSSSQTASASKSEATPEPEFAYTSSYKLLDTGTTDYLSIYCYTDEGFYASYDEIVGEREHEGKLATYENEFAIYSPKILFIDYDGKVTVLDNFTASELPDRSGEEGVYSYESSSYIQGISVINGSIYALESIFESWFTEEGVSYEDENYWDSYKYDSSTNLLKLDSDGTVIEKTAIELSEDESIYGDIVIDKDGNFLLTSNESIRAISPDGSPAYEIDVEGLGYPGGVYCATDGEVYALMWPDDGAQKLYKIDTAACELTSPVEFPSDAYQLISGGGDYLFYYNSGVTFYGFDSEKGEPVKLFNWIDLDINGESVNKAGILSDGRIVTAGQKFDLNDSTFSVELYTVENVPYSSIPKKTSVTLATQYLSSDNREKIIEFNRKNSQYHIDVIDYSEYNTEDDYSAGLTKMTTEILAGNIPDIIDLSSMSMSQLASKGILEDLYPYIDRDFNRSDYFENVLSAYEIDGKLYTTINGFSIISVIGATSVVGDEPGWTYDEFNEALASMPEGCTAFEKYTTRDSVLSNCLSLDMADFVNWSTGEVDFNNDEFIGLLKFANSFPESFDWENYDYSDEKTTTERIRSGEQMLEPVSIYSIDDYFYVGMDFGCDVTFVGYPTNNGTGNMLYVDSGYAMSSTSENKEAVWSFLKTFFEEDYQESLTNLPLMKSVFYSKLEKAQEPEYRTDSSGNILVDEEGNKLMYARYTTQNSDGEWVEIYAITEEQAKAISDLVETTTKKSTTDESISSIVEEEAAAYFSGQKSAEEVAKLIQSKVNIYVNEQR